MLKKERSEAGGGCSSSIMPPPPLLPGLTGLGFRLYRWATLCTVLPELVYASRLVRGREEATSAAVRQRLGLCRRGLPWLRPSSVAPPLVSPTDPATTSSTIASTTSSPAASSSGPMPPRRPVWVHAASLGESIAALWITRRLVHAGLGPCLITTSTVSAQTYLRGRTDVQGRESFAGSVYGDGGTGCGSIDVDVCCDADAASYTPTGTNANAAAEISATDTMTDGVSGNASASPPPAPAPVPAPALASEDGQGTVAIVVPGGLSSGKTSVINDLVAELRRCGVRVGSTLEREDGTLRGRVDVFEHHPDSLSYRSGRFDGPSAGRAAAADRRWIATHHPRFVIMNANATDGAYLGIDGAPLLLHGTLPTDCTAAMPGPHWSDFMLFTLHNARLREDGFRSADGAQAQWAKRAQQKCAWVPRQHRGRWACIEPPPPDADVRAAWARHRDRGNDQGAVTARAAAFVLRHMAGPLGAIDPDSRRAHVADADECGDAGGRDRCTWAEYVPLDTPRATLHFIDHWRPRAAIFVESELWPNLLHAASTRGVPMALVQARLSETSVVRWSAVAAGRRLLEDMVALFDVILAQDLVQARVFSDLMATEGQREGPAETSGGGDRRTSRTDRVMCVGNLKHVNMHSGGSSIILVEEEKCGGGGGSESDSEHWGGTTKCRVLNGRDDDNGDVVDGVSGRQRRWIAASFHRQEIDEVVRACAILATSGCMANPAASVVSEGASVSAGSSVSAPSAASLAASSETTYRRQHRHGETADLHQVTWKTAGKDITFTAAHGETVRTAALRRGLVSPHNGRANLVNCRGLGTCGTCAVQIDGNMEPMERSAKEELRLNLPPHGGSGSSSSSLRLACQVQVQGDMTVTKRTGFWGQYNEVAVGSMPTAPFGELEFLLDDKSPPKAGKDDDGFDNNVGTVGNAATPPTVILAPRHRDVGAELVVKLREQVPGMPIIFRSGGDGSLSTLSTLSTKIDSRMDLRGDSVHACATQTLAQTIAQCPPGSALILDTVGELTEAYTHCAVAFVGGSLHPSLKGHNIAEAAHAGAMIVHGPHMSSFQSTVDALREIDPHCTTAVTSGGGLAGVVRGALHCLTPETENAEGAWELTGAMKTEEEGGGRGGVGRGGERGGVRVAMAAIHSRAVLGIGDAVVDFVRPTVGRFVGERAPS